MKFLFADGWDQNAASELLVSCSRAAERALSIAGVKNADVMVAKSLGFKDIASSESAIRRGFVSENVNRGALYAFGAEAATSKAISTLLAPRFVLRIIDLGLMRGKDLYSFRLESTDVVMEAMDDLPPPDVLRLTDSDPVLGVAICLRVCQRLKSLLPMRTGVVAATPSEVTLILR